VIFLAFTLLFASQDVFALIGMVTSAVALGCGIWVTVMMIYVTFFWGR
jgi:hypothetical protein